MTANTTLATTLTTGHVGINVTDLQRSVQFYAEVFGFEVLRESHEAGRRFAFLAHAGKLLVTLWEQSEGQFAPNQPGLHHLAFQVESIDDVRAFEARLRAINGRFLYDSVVPHSEGAESGGIFFEDPDGIRLEIYSPTGVSDHHAPVSGAPSCGFF